MGRIFESLSRGVLVLLILGGMLIFISGRDFIISIKPSKDFQDLMDMENVKSGMHIKGDVLYAYDCFAREETWKESNGSRTPAKTSHYYYVIPVSDGNACVALEVSVDDYSSMEDLAEETVDYILNGDSAPSTKVSVNGGTKKMSSDMEKLFKDYLEDFGYSDAEIDAMEMLVIEQPHSMLTVQLMFLLGVVMVALSVFLFVRSYKKNAPAAAAE